MIDLVSKFRHIRQLLLFCCFIFSLLLPWWRDGAGVEPTLAHSVAAHRQAESATHMNGLPLQISPLSPLESPQDPAPEIPPTPTLPAPPEPTPDEPIDVAAASTEPVIVSGGPFYSGVAARQMSPVLLGAVLVSLLGLIAALIAGQR